MSFDTALEVIKTKYSIVKLEDEKNDTSKVMIG